MRNDQELRNLFNQIPNVPPPPPPYLNHLHNPRDHVAPEPSLPNPFSNMFHSYGAAAADSAPFLSRQNHRHYSECESSSKKVDNNIMSDDDDDLLLMCKYFSGMNISNEPSNGVVFGDPKRREYYDDIIMNSLNHHHHHHHNPHVPSFFEQKTETPFHHFYNDATPYIKDYTFAPALEKQGIPFYCYEQFQLHNTNPSSFDATSTAATPYYPFLCSQATQSLDHAVFDVKNKSPFMFSQNIMQPTNHVLNQRVTRNSTANTEFSQVRNGGGGDPLAFNYCDSSFIIQGEDVKKYCVHNGCKCKKNEVGIQVVPQVIPHAAFENSSNSSSTVLSPLLQKFYSLAETQGFIFRLAKDQNGCRFLQRIIDEGPPEVMSVVFNGVIVNVVELMMDPFGNYLVQKLLDVCQEDQRLHIVIILTKEPGQLVRTSMNSHGQVQLLRLTRVVQKLIETLKTRKQVSLLRSAIQPGFLELVKDLNGNHVIQRCLQVFSCPDNEFIFDAATKFCVDIATHQHGCCVLQRCIDQSMGKYQDKLITEISKHALFLAQDPYGNYVITYIIEMKIPSFSAKLVSQFKGNYVKLSMQKFSSHVVESCLKHVGECRAKIVRELLSARQFVQLLQDPYANYVVQSALAVTKGSLHASLVEAVRPHKVLRTSPYCKRIFSRELFKKLVKYITRT
ncbi:hypothetical protein RIF29_16884 [Crotalaria pallida]|uniref:PUM-HD domain-containing protein n=1 Tax=Crotalaria pallida TaxID=3830 RepID=A0AAN9FG21_CROPI